MFGVCNVNFCKNESTGECVNCKDVSFCEVHCDHFKFHFRRCQYVDCRNKIGYDSYTSLIPDSFHSKFSPCSSLRCFKNNFIFCGIHSLHSKHGQLNVPVCGYSFVGEEIEIDGSHFFKCSEFGDGGSGILGQDDKYFRKLVSVEDVSVSNSQLVLNVSSRKRKVYGLVSNSSVSKNKVVSKFRKNVNVAESMSVNTTKGLRYKHLCPRCGKNVLSTYVDLEDGLNVHWRRYCSVAGKEGGDKILECEDGVTLIFVRLKVLQNA